MSCANATSRRITLCVVVVAIVGGCMLWKSKKRWIQVELSCITHAPIYIHVVGTWWVMICKEQQRLRTKAIKDTNKVCAIESTHLASLDISILVGSSFCTISCLQLWCLWSRRNLLPPCTRSWPRNNPSRLRRRRGGIRRKRCETILDGTSTSLIFYSCLWHALQPSYFLTCSLFGLYNMVSNQIVVRTIALHILRF